MPFDLFLGVPEHRVPDVVWSPGCVWTAGSRSTRAPSRPRTPDVYAVGDVTSVGTPKAGVFAERQAAVVADRIIAPHAAAELDATYDGLGICYLEFGHDQVAKVEVTFKAGRPPNGRFEAPSTRAPRRQGRVRDQPGAALVRPGVDEPLARPSWPENHATLSEHRV